MSITHPDHPLATGVAIDVPVPALALRRLLGVLLATVVIAAAVAVLLVRSPGGTVDSIPDPYVRAWTQQETLDHLARINGFAPGASTTVSGTRGVPTTVR